eukprot:Gb_06218 [translate_table: standard]
MMMSRGKQIGLSETMDGAKTKEADNGVLIVRQPNCQIKIMVCRWILLLFCALLSRIMIFPLISQLQDIRRSYQWLARPTLDPMLVISSDSNPVPEPNRRHKFLEVPQIIWGLNNQKIALARAALTARELNRTLLMPKLSASLFYKETDQLERIELDQIFSFDRFNSLCDGFVRLGRNSELGRRTKALVVNKGNGRRWTAEKDMAQLKECRSPGIDKHELLRIEGKHPFLWHDHWPVKDYARVFECLVLVDNISAEVSRVVSKLRKLGSSTTDTRNPRIESRIPGKNFSTEVRRLSDSSESMYIAVHMRIEKDWMIHCKKLEMRAKTRHGRDLRICSSKEEIITRVARIPGLRIPSVVYLAVADDLLEDTTLLDGWNGNLVPYEKKKLGVVDIYAKYPYLIQSAIDYEVCLQADIFVGNSFSTFSSLIVLQRTMRLIKAGLLDACGDSILGSYAYNIEDAVGGPQKWVTNMSDLSLATISYGSNEVSCLQH